MFVGSVCIDCVFSSCPERSSVVGSQATRTHLRSRSTLLYSLSLIETSSRKSPRCVPCWRPCFQKIEIVCVCVRNDATRTNRSKGASPKRIEWLSGKSQASWQTSSRGHFQKEAPTRAQIKNNCVRGRFVLQKSKTFSILEHTTIKNIMLVMWHAFCQGPAIMFSKIVVNIWTEFG